MKPKAFRKFCEILNECTKEKLHYDLLPAAIDFLNENEEYYKAEALEFILKNKVEAHECQSTFYFRTSYKGNDLEGYIPCELAVAGSYWNILDLVWQFCCNWELYYSKIAPSQILNKKDWFNGES